MQKRGRAKALEAEESAHKLRESVAQKKHEQAQYNAEMRRLRILSCEEHMKTKQAEAKMRAAKILIKQGHMLA